MAKIKFTDAAMASLTLGEGQKEALVWDTGVSGLGLRIGRQHKSWVYVYRPRGTGRTSNPQKVGLGRWPGVSVKDARTAARIEAGKVSKGVDPAAARREGRRKAKSTLVTLLDEYEVTLVTRRLQNVTDVMSALRRGLAPFRTRDVATIQRHEIVRIVEKMEAAGKPGAAKAFRGHARTMLEWAYNRGTLTSNVLSGLQLPRSTRAERLDVEVKGRALTAEELVRVWLAADPKTTFGRYIRALILTGARRQEMSRLHQRMLLSDRMSLPPTHTKQGKPHDVPLVPALVEILAECPLVPSRLLFASRTTGREMKGWTKMVEKLSKKSGVDFRLHDLRRTYRSGLTDLGIEETLAEVMIAHQRPSLLQIYDKADLWGLRTDAANRWAAHVETLVGIERGQNVVMIKQGQAA